MSDLDQAAQPLTREEYEEQQRTAGLYEDITYGPSGSAHPYDFFPDSDPGMCTPDELAAHAEACRQVEEGTYPGSPEFQLGTLVTNWGWGGRRFWFTGGEDEVAK